MLELSSAELDRVGNARNAIRPRWSYRAKLACVEMHKELDFFGIAGHIIQQRYGFDA